MNSIPFSIHLWDKDCRIIDCNEAALMLSNIREKSEYLGRYMELFPEYQPDGQLSVEKHAMIIKKVFADGRNQVLEWMRQTPDGMLVPVEITCALIKFKDDNVVISYSRDLREYKKMMKDIEQQTSELEFKSH